MTQRTDLALAEVGTDIAAVHNQLRDALPALVVMAADQGDWPDTLLTGVAVTVARSVCRLDATTGLLADAGLLSANQN